jgi:Transposase DDE domain
MKAEALRQAALEAQKEAQADPDNGRKQEQAERLEQAAQIAKEREASRKEHGRDPEVVRVCPVEPEAVVQRDKDEVVVPCYKPSILVHEVGLIVGKQVFGSSETAAVEPELDQHRQVFGQEPSRGLFDAGYHSVGVFSTCAQREIEVYCPPGRTKGEQIGEQTQYKGKLGKALFVYQPEADVYQCPAGQTLVRVGGGQEREGQRFARYQGQQCQGCERRSQCTDAASGRTIKRYQGDELKEAVVRRMRDPEARKVYKRRAVLAERPFAELKERQGLRRFHRRGLGGVRVEFSLHCVAFNFRRVVKGSLGGRGLAVVLGGRRPGGPWQLLAVWLLLI